MFKIGEFSKLTQVTIRMLRHYDETGLLKPAETDPWTGYRLYSAKQIPVLERILYLRDSGFHIAEIAAILGKEDDAFLVEQLDGKYKELEKTILTEQERLRKIEIARNEILLGKSEMHYHVTLRSVPGCQVLSLRRTVPDYYAEGVLWEEMQDFARKYGIAVSADTFTIYHDNDFRETDVDIEICAPVEKKGENREGFTFREIEPVPLMACTMSYGSFGNIAGAYHAFAGWLQDQDGYRMQGENRQIVHRGPWNEENPDDYLTEIQIPLDSHIV